MQLGHLTMDALIHPSAQAVLDGDVKIRERFGVVVSRAQEGECDLSLVVDEGWINAAGYTHGSVAYAVMDSACAYASASLKKLAVTVNGNVTYTRGTQAGAVLSVRAKLLSQSKRVMTFHTDITDERQRLIAHGSFVFQIIGERE